MATAESEIVEKPKKLRPGQVVMIVILGIAGLMFLGLLAASNQPAPTAGTNVISRAAPPPPTIVPTPQKPASLATADKSITEIRFVRHTLMVSSVIDTNYVGAEIVFHSKDNPLGSEAAEVVAPILKAFQHGGAEDISRVTKVSITFFANGMDRLGNPQKLALMTIDYSAADIRKAHLDVLGDYGAMNLASGVTIWRPEMRDGIVSLCSDVAQFAPAFCSMALES